MGVPSGPARAPDDLSSPAEEAAPLTSALLRERAGQALQRRPVDAHTRGRGAEGLKLGARQLEAEYEIPYLAHAPWSR